MAVYKHVPNNLMVTEMICQEEWDKLPIRNEGVFLSLSEATGINMSHSYVFGFQGRPRLCKLIVEKYNHNNMIR